MIHFSLAKEIYATQFENAVIVLDVSQDQYLSLIDDAASYFKQVLSLPFEQSGDKKYIPCIEQPDQTAIDSFNHWINEYLQNGFIVKTNSPVKKTIYPPAKVAGGLREYQWDTKKDWKPFKKTSLWAAFRAFLTLVKVNRAIKKEGMRGLFTLINKTKKISHKAKSLPQNLETVIAATDAATKLHPKKTYCLGWAATFVLEARRRGVECKLLVGIQSNPFYAHAWAELEDGTVINDDPQVANVLSVIATLPEDIQ